VREETQHANLQLHLSSHSASSRTRSVPRCSHHKRQFRRDSARTLHAPVDRAGHSACEINPERWKDGKGLTHSDRGVLSVMA
jgi:hypothetical protein